MDARPTPASDAAALAALLVGACVGAGVAHAAFSSEKRRDGDGGVSRHSISSAIASSLFAPLRWMATTLPTSSSTTTTTTHPPPRGSVRDMIGNTPMQRVESLSRLTGCDVLIKCEFANPGGSVKDRVALRIVREALASGELRPGGEITEGTAGSTGVSVALVAAALGCKARRPARRSPRDRVRAARTVPRGLLRPRVSLSAQNPSISQSRHAATPRDSG
jgi:hypothetical protein